MMYSFCTHIRHSEGFFEEAKPFLSSYSSLLYYILPLLTVFFSSYNLTVCCRETPRKFQFAKKSAKVYHCLSSSTEQLQMALWSLCFFSLSLNNEKSVHTLPLQSQHLLSLHFNPSFFKPTVSSPWSVWLLKLKEKQSVQQLWHTDTQTKYPR